MASSPVTENAELHTLQPRPRFVLMHFVYLPTYAAHISLIHDAEPGQENKHLSRACKVDSITVVIRLCHSRENNKGQSERRTHCSQEINVKKRADMLGVFLLLGGSPSPLRTKKVA